MEDTHDTQAGVGPNRHIPPSDPSIQPTTGPERLRRTVREKREKTILKNFDDIPFPRDLASSKVKVEKTVKEEDIDNDDDDSHHDHSRKRTRR